MTAVTLTSDLGTRDFYLAALKGTIISHFTDVNIIDVTHHIKPFDIKEAAFVIGNACRYFPKGTIHIVHVNGSERKTRLLLSLVHDQYFLTFDNGLISMAFPQIPYQTYEVNEELFENNSLLFEQGIARVIEFLHNEYKPTDFAHLVTDTLTFRLLQPSAMPGNIRGSVIYIDQFGNAVTNITRQMFAENIGDKKFNIMTNVVSTNTLSKNYNDVEEGEMVCLFNSGGLLEVAINKGKAENLLGLKVSVSSVLVQTQ